MNKLEKKLTTKDIQKLFDISMDMLEIFGEGATIQAFTREINRMENTNDFTDLYRTTDEIYYKDIDKILYG